MTSNEFVLWLNGFLDAVSQVEGHHLAKIKSKLKDVNDNTLPEYIKPPKLYQTEVVLYNDVNPRTSTTSDIPFTYNGEGQYLKKEILKG